MMTNVAVAEQGVDEPTQNLRRFIEAAELEATVSQAIEACGGDPVAAVRALIVANGMLEHELATWQRSTRNRRKAICVGDA